MRKKGDELRIARPTWAVCAVHSEVLHNSREVTRHGVLKQQSCDKDEEDGDADEEKHKCLRGELADFLLVQFHTGGVYHSFG